MSVAIWVVRSGVSTPALALVGACRVRIVLLQEGLLRDEAEHHIHLFLVESPNCSNCRFYVPGVERSLHFFSKRWEAGHLISTFLLTL